MQLLREAVAVARSMTISGGAARGARRTMPGRYRRLPQARQFRVAMPRLHSPPLEMNEVPRVHGPRLRTQATAPPPSGAPSPPVVREPPGGRDCARADCPCVNHWPARVPAPMRPGATRAPHGSLPHAALFGGAVNDRSPDEARDCPSAARPLPAAARPFARRRQAGHPAGTRRQRWKLNAIQ